MLEGLNNAFVMLVARVLIVLIYCFGITNLFTGGVPVEYAASKGFPAWVTWIGYLIKVVAAFAILVGFQTRLAALGLIAFTLVTAFFFHAPWASEGYTFWKEISMIGGLLLLAAVGPGAFSIDERASEHRNSG